ncbi:hypothetical protein HMPREF9151_00131 [Hoylesella saccharolytica F0055]|uniref:Uncharacterized protein n=1 Tax=Hoylesella saccharolytica F0055 TaxID=1127699 RepID=L1NLD9_9BACT|nr:hypothetical protein HMPREF9151_00131 [Hoylesella saccharolytica F0055]
MGRAVAFGKGEESFIRIYFVKIKNSTVMSISYRLYKSKVSSGFFHLSFKDGRPIS